MTPFLRSCAAAEGVRVPHIVIVDECGCRRARAAAFVLEAWLEKQGVLTVVDWGPSAFWQKFIPCEVRCLHVCVLVAMSTLAPTHTHVPEGAHAHDASTGTQMHACKDCRSSGAAKPVVRGGR